MYTDNNPLTYVLSTTKVCTTGHICIAGKANYNIDIHLQLGKPNVEADTLSRIKWNKLIMSEAVQVVIANIAQSIDSPNKAYSNSVTIFNALQ